MRKITTAILAFILCLSQYQIMAQCVSPQFSYSGVNSQYNLNSPIPTLYVTHTGGTVTSGSSLINFNSPIGQPTGITVDALGNIYVLESANNQIKKMTPNGIITVVVTGFNAPRGLSIDQAGVLYVADTGNNVIKKIDTNNTVTIIGSGFSSPRGVAVDQNGNVYVADTGNNAIKKISTANVVSTVATGLSIPSGVAIDVVGNLYVAETGNNNIKKISTNNVITTLGFGFQFPEAVVVDSNGLVYVADTGNNAIKKISLDNQTTTLAGSYTSPKGIAVDANGNVYVSDTSNNSVEKISANNSTSSLTHISSPRDIVIDASNNIYLLDKNNKMIRKRSVDGTLSIFASGFTGPSKMAMDGLGNMYVADLMSTSTYFYFIKKISPSGSITIIAFNFPDVNSLAADPLGQVYVKQGQNNIKKIDLSGTVTTVNPYMSSPKSLACDAAGNVYVTDGYRINKLTNTEVVNITNGVVEFTNYYFENIAIDNLGNIYTINYYSNQLIKISPNGIISNLSNTTYSNDDGIALDSFGRIYKPNQNANTVTRYNYFQISPPLPKGLNFNVLNGQISGTPTEAALSTTYTISAGNDCGIGSTQITFGVCSSTVSILSQSDAAVVCEGSSKSLRVEAVGCNLTYQWYKDGTPISGALSSILNLTNISATSLGSYHCVVTGSSGSVTSNTMGLSLNSSPAISYSPVSSTYFSGSAIAPIIPTNTGGTITPSSESIFGLTFPFRVATDTNGNIYLIENAYNTKIRKISPNGVVTLIGPTLNLPYGITVDSSNNVYVIESKNSSSIQKIDPSGGVTIIATGIYFPQDITVDADGNIYYIEDNINFIKKIALDGTTSMLGSGLFNPLALTLDALGNIYVIDNGNSLKKINTIGTVTTISGVGTYFVDLDTDAAGNVYVTTGNDIKKVDPNNTVTPYNLINTYCYGIDLDSNGNIYITDQNNTLRKIEPDGDNFTLISGFSQVESLANDAEGNTYIADFTNNLKKIASNTLNTTNIATPMYMGVVAVDVTTIYTANENGNLYKKIGNGAQTLFKTGLGTIKYIVVDEEGNIYLNTSFSNVIKKITPSGLVTNLNLSLSDPKGMAVDSQGNLYVADWSNNLVKKRAPNGTLTNVGSGFNNPIDVAIDPTGNVYVADSGNNLIKRVSLDGSISIVSNNFSNITDISMDGLGNLYVVHSDKRRVSKISSLVNYTITPSLPAGLTLHPETGVISGTPTILSPFTTYSIRVGNSCGNTATTLGFEICSPPVIITQPLSKTACAGNNVTFSLTATGCNLNYQWYLNGTAIDEANEASLVLNNITDSDNGTYNCEITTPYGNLLSETVSLNVLTDRIISYPDVISNYQYGVEMTPLNLTITGGSIVTNEISVSDLSSGTQYSKDIARGNDGSIYMIGYGYTGIKKWSPDGTLTNIYTGLGYLDAVAVDNQNNLYVVNTFNNEIKKIALNGTVTNIGTGIIYPAGIVVDANGVVYVYANGDNAIKKIALDGTVTTWATGFDNPSGLEIKEDGSIYVADTYNNAIKIISPEGIVSTAVDNLEYLNDLSTDGRGNFYFTDLYYGTVKKINAQGIITTVTNNITSANRIVSDSDGILYVSTSPANLVKIIQGVSYTVTPALPTGMTLDPLTGTISGTPLTFVPTTSYTVSINNGCNTFNTNISFSTCGPIIMDVQPTSQTLCAGGNVFLNTVARGCNLGYQWYKNSTPVTGATSSTLELLNVGDSDNGDYLCFVTSPEGNVVSETATVVVNLSPIINYNDLSSGYYLNEPMTPLIPTNTGGALHQNQYITSTYRAVPDTFMDDFAQDAVGNFYICDTYGGTIKKVDTNGNITIVNNTINQPNNIAVDSEGNVFVNQQSSNSILKIDTAGNLTTAISGIDYPNGLSIDASNNIYVAELYANTVKKISPDGTVLNTWAVNGYPYSLAVSPSGTIYVAISSGVILKIENDTITEIADSIWNVRLSVGADGTVYTGGYYIIKKINPDGSIEEINVYFGYYSKVIPGASNTLYVFNYSTNTIDKITGPHLYTISPALPAGMQFDVQTGIISGTPTVLTPTTTYTIKTRNNCGDNYAHITFAVCTSTVIDLQPLPQTVCAGTSVSFEVIGSGSDVTYQWLKDNVAIAGATNPVFTIQYPTDNDVASYSCFVSGNCGSLTSEAVNLAVINNNSSAITTQPINANLCSPAGSTTSFTVATIMPEATYTWQYRIISTTNVNPGWNNLNDSINGVFSGITSPTLTITKASNYPPNGTQFRVIINGTCGSVISDIATVYIVGATAAGRITAPTSVCLNNNIDFILLGESGTSIQWQSAPNATGTFTDIPGANEQVYTLMNAQTNSHLAYRAVVSNSCDNTSATTAIKTIKVDLPSLSGTVTGGGYLCSSGSSTLKLTGYRGKIQWEYSTDGINFSNAPRVTNLQTDPFSTTSTVSTSTTYLVSNLTTNVFFRAKVTSGTCTSEYSNVVLYTLVNNAVAGYITAGSTTICAGSGTTLLELNDVIGTILWERSTDLVTWYSTGKTQSTFEVKNLTVRTAYRAKVSVGGCATVYSESIFIELAPKSLAKAIAVNTTLPSGKTALTAMCTNDASKVLTIGNGYVGAIQWQRSATSNTLGYTNIEGANGQSFTVTNPLSGANYFRAKFTNSCGVSVFSAAVIVYYTDCIQARAVVSNKKMSFDALAYPNPYSDSFRFKLSTSSVSEVTLAVYDMTGKLLERSVKRPEDIQQENLGLNYASGVYNIVVTQDDETKTVRIVKR
ncbi:immunoglobulin domain-containing protein [Flavobacterium sp.]|uniref:virginiamycin B lyase family protein n=1 Tax=Flavobacterium sp. TaxID=239 RepID=UPI00391AA844